MKKHSAEFPGPLGWRMRTSNTFPRSPSPERGIQIYGLCRIVFPALFLLIFSLAVLGGTASSAEEGATNTF